MYLIAVCCLHRRYGISKFRLSKTGSSTNMFQSSVDNVCNVLVSGAFKYNFRNIPKLEGPNLA